MASLAHWCRSGNVTFTVSRARADLRSGEGTVPGNVIQPTLRRVPTGARAEPNSLSCQLQPCCVLLQPTGVSIMLSTHRSVFVAVQMFQSLCSASTSPQQTRHPLSGLLSLPHVSCCDNRRFTEALIEALGHRTMLNAHRREQQ